MSTVGDIMGTLWCVQYTGGKHEYTGGKHKYTGGLSILNVGEVIGNTVECVWKPQCTEHPQVYTKYPPVY